MDRLLDAVYEIDAYFHAQGWKYCLIGGIAVARWGEPRATNDVDLCLLTGLGSEQIFINSILSAFTPRIEDAANFAEQNRVLLIQNSSGVAIDISLGWTPFENRLLERASPFQLAKHVSIPTASAEDLIVMKAFASRTVDWADIKRILARQRGKLDWNYIHRELTSLCELKESPEIVDQLQSLREQIDAE